MSALTALTKEQSRALAPEASVWVSASAGTGKTHVLTARVLKLMLRGTPPDKILCLTFTKAAAAEMANRILEELGQWVGLADERLSAELASRVGEKADAEMLIEARALFARVLDLPGGLRIQTIHSFCQSLLGRFPLEAEIAPHFQVMDERTASEFAREATEALLVDARYEKKGGRLRRALTHMARHVTESVYEDLMKAIAFHRPQLSKLFRTYGNLDGVIAATRRQLGVSEKETFEIAVRDALADGTFDGARITRLAEALSSGTDAEAAKGAILTALLCADAVNRQALYPDYASVFLKKDGEARKSVANKPTLEANPGLAEIIATETERLKSLSEHLSMIVVAENTEALLTLASSFLDNYDRTKRRHDLLDYDDLIFTTDRLMQRPGIAPWILYKLDGGIDHIMVDEAQDTNPEQWRLLDVLSDEFFAGTGAREQVRTVFAVGDAKQSIFSFQRADPAGFLRARDRIARRAEDAGLEFGSVSLARSFRSTRTVLDLVDEVFSRAPASAGLTLDDEPIRHQEHRRGESGLVELWQPEPASLDDGDDEQSDGWSPPTKQEPATSAEARLARRIAARISDMLSSGEELVARGRAIRPDDIMVLVRRRSDFVVQLIKALKARDVPVAGADRMVLTNQLAVMDLVALARFVLLPGDDLTLATVLKGPFIGLSEDALFDLAYDRGKTPLWRALRKQVAKSAVFSAAVEFLTEALGRADFVAPYEFFADLLDRQQGRRQLIGRLGHEVNDPVDEFLALALSYERTHTPSLEGFLSWLDAGEAEIKRDLDRAVAEVRIMTVHGAKGLQAPIVFLPDTCQISPDRERLLKINTDQKTAKSAEDENALLVWPGGKENEAGRIRQTREEVASAADAEYRRLLYVALTRAEDRLYISGWETRNARSEKCWYDLIEPAFGTLENVSEVNDSDGRPILRIEGQQLFAPKADQPRGQSRGGNSSSCDLPALPDWLDRAPPEEPAGPVPLTPSQAGAEGKDEFDEPPVSSPRLRLTTGKSDTAAMARGRIIHKLLELLPRFPLGEREAAARHYLAQVAPAYGPAEIDDIWHSMKSVLEHPDLGPLFGPGSRAEVAVSGIVGAFSISGQVDRLVITDDQVLIVDYKTNRPPPPDPAGVPIIYLKQMAHYQALLEAVYPDKKVRTALLWTEETRLMELDNNLIAPYRPDWREQNSTP